MNRNIPASALSPRLRIALSFLLGITLLNYIAQIPYYIHFYGVYHGIPNPLGVVIFLVATLALFLVGYFLTLQMKRFGGWLLLAFLALEFVGYLGHNLSGAFLRDLPTNDPLFFTVSLIGYLNLAASFIYLIVIITFRGSLLFARRRSLSENGAVMSTHSRS
jgi:hypothetical protein